MKRGALILMLLLLISLASSQTVDEIPETVDNRLSLEFHALTGTDIVTLDLPKYFGKNVEFVHNNPENVDVTIDPTTKVATMKSNNPEWRGIETVVFATSVEYLEDKRKSKGILLPRNVTKVLINVSKEDIALDTDAFTQVQFETILGNLTSEPIEIFSELSDKSLLLRINDEVNFNITFENAKPTMDMLWKLKTTGNMTSARYKEGSDIVTFSLILFVLCALIVVVLYVYYGYVDNLKFVIFAPKKAKRDIREKSQIYKKKALSDIRLIQKKVGKEKGSKLYKEGLNIMNKFLADALGIRGTNVTKISERLRKMGMPTGLTSKIEIYITERKSRAYSGKEITEDDVNNFINFITSIIKKISR